MGCDEGRLRRGGAARVVAGKTCALSLSRVPTKEPTIFLHTPQTVTFRPINTPHSNSWEFENAKIRARKFARENWRRESCAISGGMRGRVLPVVEGENGRQLLHTELFCELWQRVDVDLGKV
jgi:hypothetical protein